MNLTIVTPPEDLASLIEESVWDHLRRSANPSDAAYILDCVGAAVSRLDGPQGRLRRALLTQSWKLTMDAFPCVIELSLPPVQSVTSLKYLDGDGTQQTLAADKYRLSGIGGWQAEVSPAYGTAWPDTRYLSDAIEIEFVTGFGDAETDIPESILAAIRQLAAHYYAERQPITFSTPQEIPLLVKDLLAPWKVYR